MALSDKKLTYISLFSSAGVGCYGFLKEQFNCVASVEIIERRLQVQRANKTCIYESGYIADDITKETTKERIFQEIDHWRSSHKTKDIDVIVATPPCQGMSVANHKKNNEGPRNSLIVESIGLVSEIKPRIFVFENVRSFLTTTCTNHDGKNRPIREAIELGLGGNYNIHYQVINFKEYGNPSSRTRTLVVGTRKDMHEVTPIDLMPKRQPVRTLRDVIGDLPELNEMGQIDSNDVYHNFRPYTPHMRSWIETLREGQSAFDNQDLKRRPHKIVDGKVVSNVNKNGDKYSRCFWDRVGPCVHTRNDILASQATIHPKDDRVFSIRELMRLMSIPDSFKWSDISNAKLNRLSSDEKRKFLNEHEMNIRQSIGEAVPTVIFRQIARNIRTLVNRPGLSEIEIRKIIQSKKLTDLNKLKQYIILNLRNYRYWELAKIVELANAERMKYAAYYTRQDICFTVVKDLPDASDYKSLRILEPAVGAGNFLPLLIEKYRIVPNVEIDVIDIDSNAIQILKQLVRKIDIPANMRINFIVADFLTYGETSLLEQGVKYDIAVGNPPYGSVAKDPKLLAMYRKNKFNKKTTNLFALFLENCLAKSDHVGLIIPKSFLSAPEFDLSRELVSNFALKKITDYGEKAFKGVKIETISLIVDVRNRGDQTLVESYIKQHIELKPQKYICSTSFPYWLVYRNSFFDQVAKRLRFNIFTSYRDRQITKKITAGEGKIRILKSRNIGSNKILNIPNYDSFVDSLDGLSISKFWNKEKSVLVPNLTYAPRASFLPRNTLVDGSVAILTPRETESNITEKDLAYFGTEEFTQFYKVARNFGTRSLNIDNNSVFFFGVQDRN